VKAPTDRALLDESPFDFLPPFPPAWGAGCMNQLMPEFSAELQF
jgi:hypothetical protein